MEPALRTVIVPLDGSRLAEQVLPHVIGLGKALRTRLMPVRVTPTPADYHPLGYPVGRFPDFFQKIDAEASTYLDDITERLRGEDVFSVEP